MNGVSQKLLRGNATPLRLLRIGWMAALVLIVCHPCFSWQPPADVAPEKVDETDTETGRLANRLKQFRSLLEDSDTTDSVRQSITDILNQADVDLAEARNQQQVAEAIQKATNELSGEVQKLSTTDEKPAQDSLEKLTSAELDSRIAAAQATLTTAQARLPELEAAAADPTLQKRELQQQDEQFSKQLTEAVEALARIPQNAPQATEQAQRLSLAARQLRLQHSQQRIQAALGLLSAELALNLPSLRVTFEKNLIAMQTAELESLRAEAERRRKAESSEQLAQAKTAEEDLSVYSTQDLRDLAVRRSELAAINDQLARQGIPDAERRLTKKSALIERIELQKRKIQNRVERFGTTGTIGRDLLHFHHRFPKRDELLREVQELDEALSVLRPQQLDYSDELDAAETMAAQDDETLNEDDRELIEGYRKLLRLLTDNTIRLSATLSDLDGENRRILAIMDEWDTYASEHSLWFRSHDALSAKDFRDLPKRVKDAASEVAASVSTVMEMRDSTFYLLSILAFGVFVVLLFVQKKAKSAIHEQARAASRGSCRSMRPTLKALLMTAAVAGEWPILSILTGNMLHLAGGAAWGVGSALIQLGAITLWMNCLKHTVCAQGLAQTHFRWNHSVCDKLRRWIHLLLAVSTVPLLCLLFVRLTGADNDSLERILFVLLMLIISATTVRLFAPLSNPFVRLVGSISPVVHATRLIWAGIPVVVPILFAVLSAAGFHFTAVELALRGAWSIVALSIVLLCHQLLVRWINVSATAARLQQAQKRAEARSTGQTEGAVAAGTETIPPVAQQDEDPELFGLQADALARNAALLVAAAFAWMIWTDVLPALRLLDREALWHVTEEVSITVPGETESTDTDSGAAPAKTETIRRPITVGNLLFAFFALTLTVLGVRQLPGLIEVVLQSQSRLDAGMRYTICTVTQYAVLIAGAMIVCRAVGLRWSQVQWLVAGLSVGLGFGLQEVFANFVSGLIILIERPVRIGDIVTIDGVSGIVSRIRIRATAITDWDRREYIVPNREFVTGKLLNWTLSDTTNRVVIPVGIAYGTDPDKAREILMAIATDHSNILNDPAPITTFENFGDNSLDLVLRAYLPDLDNRLGTITELYTEINRRFAEAGIEIPYPQRDVHVRSQPAQQSN